MNVARGLKIHDFFFVFLFAFKNKQRFENFFRSLCKVWVLCDFLNLSCLRIIVKARQFLSHSVSIFLLNAS